MRPQTGGTFWRPPTGGSLANLRLAVLGNFRRERFCVCQSALHEVFWPAKMIGGSADAPGLAIHVLNFPDRHPMAQHIRFAASGRVAEPNAAEFLFPSL